VEKKRKKRGGRHGSSPSLQVLSQEAKRKGRGREKKEEKSSPELKSEGKKGKTRDEPIQKEAKGEKIKFFVDRKTRKKGGAPSRGLVIFLYSRNLGGRKGHKKKGGRRRESERDRGTNRRKKKKGRNISLLTNPHG